MIIPYQEPPGNYNYLGEFDDKSCIIPYQEPPGNYNNQASTPDRSNIIPYQETSTYKKNFF